MLGHSFSSALPSEPRTSRNYRTGVFPQCSVFTSLTSPQLLTRVFSCSRAGCQRCKTQTLGPTSHVVVHSVRQCVCVRRRARRSRTNTQNINTKVSSNTSSHTELCVCDAEHACCPDVYTEQAASLQGAAAHTWDKRRNTNKSQLWF